MVKAGTGVGTEVDFDCIEYYVIGNQSVDKAYIEELGGRVIKSDFFRYPVSLSDMRVKIEGEEDSTKVNFLRVDSDTIELTTYAPESYVARYPLPEGRAIIQGESGELNLPVKNISYGYVAIDKKGMDVAGIKPHTIELHTSIGISVVSEIIRSTDRDEVIVFELKVDLVGWISVLRDRASKNK
jgi:hypothetical protein